MRIVVVLVFVIACRKDEPARRVVETPAPGPQKLEVAGDAAMASDAAPAPEPDAMLAPTVDAGPADYSQLATAEWPTALEVETVERKGRAAKGSVDLSYPKFRVRPKAIADELNAKVAKLIEFGSDPEDRGIYTLSCELVTVSRIAVMVRCGKMLEVYDETNPAMPGGAPAGLHPMTFAYWMQPGLPRITIDQLAPGIDVGKLLTVAKSIDRDHCNMAFCELSPEHFTITAEGIVFVPGEHCDSCGDLFPKIPLEQLQPTHPWAVKLVTWVRQRVDAGESLVKYQR